MPAATAATAAATAAATVVATVMTTAATTTAEGSGSEVQSCARGQSADCEAKSELGTRGPQPQGSKGRTENEVGWHQDGSTGDETLSLAPSLSAGSNRSGKEMHRSRCFMRCILYVPVSKSKLLHASFMSQDRWEQIPLLRQIAMSLPGRVL